MDSCLIRTMCKFVSFHSIDASSHHSLSHQVRWQYKLKFNFCSFSIVPQGVFYRRNGSIFFQLVDESHAGRYSCTPYNELGTEGPSPLIRGNYERKYRFYVDLVHKIVNFSFCTTTACVHIETKTDLCA